MKRIPLGFCCTKNYKGTSSRRCYCSRGDALARERERESEGGVGGREERSSHFLYVKADVVNYRSTFRAIKSRTSFRVIDNIFIIGNTTTGTFNAILTTIMANGQSRKTENSLIFPTMKDRAVGEFNLRAKLC